MSATAPTQGETFATTSWIPLGVMVDYCGSADPDGWWMLCDGRAISRTTYANLFTVISTTYGTGNGSTTFNIPDLRGRGVVGPDNMGTAQGAAARLTSNNARGNSAGAQSVALALGDMPPHIHGKGSMTVDAHVHYHYNTIGLNNGDATIVAPHLMPDFTPIGGIGSHYAISHVENISVIRFGAAAGTFSYNTGSTELWQVQSTGPSSNGISGSTDGPTSSGSASAHSNMHPYQVANKLIRVL